MDQAQEFILKAQDIWKHGMTSLARLFQSVDWSRSVREIYQQIASGLLDLAACDSVSIRLLALTGDEMVGYVYAGNAEVLAKAQFPTLSINVGRMSTVFDRLEPLVYDFHAPEEGDVVSEDGIKLGYSHAVVVPLVSKGKPIGAIDFMFKDGQFDVASDQLPLLCELGRILGSVAEALGLADEILETQIREEAKRIGTELHDNFAQPLSVIALESDKALLALDEKDADRMRESLDKISNLSRQSFGMMADEVALLHSASTASENLVGDIRGYAEQFQKQWGVRIDVEAPDEEYLVPGVVGNQAMRILHEALSNVLRHSKASSALVKVSFSPAAMGLSVEDGGCGFDVKDRSATQLGLQVMEDRAKSVGGRVTIASVVGEGTTVFADLPLVS